MYGYRSVTAPTCGLGCRPPTTSRKCARAKRKSPCAVSRGRFDGSHFRPAVVDGIADRTTIGARTLIAARQGFTDVNKDRRPRPAPPPPIPRYSTSHSAGSRIRGGCQLAYLIKELLRLADEQPVGREALDRRHRAENACRDRDRANDRNYRELPAEERAGLGHDQIGLEVLPAKRRRIEVRKREIAKCQRGQRR